MKYILKSNNNSVEIRSLGGELCSFKRDGIEYIHQPNPETWNRSAPYLFPNVGAIKNKIAVIEGKEYKLTKHGFLRDIEMNKVSQTENSLVLSVEATPETLAIYPYQFKLTITYTLNNDTLNCNIEVYNNGNTPMYFNLGLHPAFQVPLYKSEKFEDYSVLFSSKISAELPTVDLASGLVDYTKVARTFNNLEVLPLNYDDYQNDALVFDPFNDTKVILEHNETKHGIVFEFEKFKTLGIWTPNHTKADFICLEPWIGCADSPYTTSYETKKDIIKLDAKSTWNTNYKITVK